MRACVRVRIERVSREVGDSSHGHTRCRALALAHLRCAIRPDPPQPIPPRSGLQSLPPPPPNPPTHTSMLPFARVTMRSRSRPRTSVGSRKRTLPTPRAPTAKCGTRRRDAGSSRAMAASCWGGKEQEGQGRVSWQQAERVDARAQGGWAQVLAAEQAGQLNRKTRTQPPYHTHAHRAQHTKHSTHHTHTCCRGGSV